MMESIFVKIFKIITCFLFLMIFGCGAESETSNKANERTEKRSPNQVQYDYGSTECVPDDNFEAGQSGFFDPQVTIQIIAFDDTTYSESPCRVNDGKFTTINSIQTITLDNKQKKELEILLESTKTKRKGNMDEGSGSYNPRHVIVFSVPKETVAFNEICFESRGQRVGAPKGTQIDFCEEKWDSLKEFFKSVGVTYFGPQG